MVVPPQTRFNRSRCGRRDRSGRPIASRPAPFTAARPPLVDLGSCTSTAPASRGATCRTTCRPGERSTASFIAWTNDGIFIQLNYALTGLAGQDRPLQRSIGRRGRHPKRQDVDQRADRQQGIDAGKRIIGRKCSIITDPLGLLLAVIVTVASISDNAVGVQLLGQARAAYSNLTKRWADAGFTITVVEHGARLGIDVEVVTRDPATRGFSVLPRRWVIERTLGWLMLHRRLARDYEARPDHSAAMILVAMIDNLTRRMTNEITLIGRDD